jgi:hypothetical protein
MAYSALPMEDLHDVTNDPFGDPSVQRMLSTDALAAAAAPTSSSAVGGSGVAAADGTAALAGFMASASAYPAATGTMSGSGPGVRLASGLSPYENTLDEPVSATLVRRPWRAGAPWTRALTFGRWRCRSCASCGR